MSNTLTEQIASIDAYSYLYLLILYLSLMPIINFKNPKFFDLLSEVREFETSLSFLPIHNFP